MSELKVLYTREQINEAIAKIAKQIDEDYKGKEVTLITVLNGAMFFSVELALNIKMDVQMDTIEASSYGSSTVSSGKVRILKDVTKCVENKHVIIVEDIVDTGITMNHLINHLSSKNPASIRTASLLDKPSRRKVPVSVDYLGYAIEDYFVVGYGLDYDEKYRNLSYIGYFI